VVEVVLRQRIAQTLLHQRAQPCPAVDLTRGTDVKLKVDRPQFELQALIPGRPLSRTQFSTRGRQPVRERVLVIGADTCSSVLDRRDRNTAVLFGDGAGAVRLCAGREGQPDEVLASRLGGDRADGASSDLVAAGGSRLPPYETCAKRGIRTYLSVGYAITEPVRRAIRAMPDRLWHPALDQDGTLRDGDKVTELTGKPLPATTRRTLENSTTALELRHARTPKSPRPLDSYP
jgi:hypothetical protein